MRAALSVLAGILFSGAGAVSAAPAGSPAVSVTPGHETPLPISVKTPADLAFKVETERQFLILNLMAGGRIGYEAGDFARAIRDWEMLLKVPNLPHDIVRVVSPLLAEAKRQRPAGAGGAAASGAAANGTAAGGTAASEAPAPEPPPLPPSTSEPAPAPPARPEAPRAVTVSGTVTGGGSIGPGAAVLWLKRLDGPTPAPHPSRRPRILGQSGKMFVPHVLAIAAGESVSFRNDDPYFHNVFSPSPGQRFDAGLYGSGRSYVKTFTHPGPVELLCNIHASMVGYLYVVDSAYYTQPRSNGGFSIRNVPPGRYELNAWHESSASVVKQAVTVGAGGATGLVVRIPGDRAPLVIVPDKYGKPRQAQLGY